MSAAQLLDLGFTRREILRLVEHGHLHPLHRGVYVVGHRNLSNKAHLIAALLVAGPDSFLSHSTSVAFQGLRAINPHQIEITLVSTGVRSRHGLILHGTTANPPKGEVISRFGLRYSSFPRALIELSTRETPEELMRLVTAAIRKGTFNADKVRRTLARHPQRPGTKIVKDVLHRYVDPTDRKSGLERSFDHHATTDPGIPPYVKNVHLGPYEIDCWWPEHAAALELDGRPYHTAINDLERDHAKDIWLQRQGIRPIRITDLRWEHDRAGAIEDLLGCSRSARNAEWREP